MSPMNARLLRPIASAQAAPPADSFATLVSNKITGNVSGAARSTTGFIKVEWWDSTTNVYGTGVAGDNITWSKAAGGAGSKTLRIYPSDASGNLSGSMSTLSCNNNSLTALNVSGLTALTILNCSQNSLTSLDVSGLTSLDTLSCFSNSLTSLNVSGCTALTGLFCSSNSLTSLNVSGLTSLTGLVCNNNSLTSLNVSGLTALQYIRCSSNSLTSLNVSGLTSLIDLDCSSTSLTSLNVSGLTALQFIRCSQNSLTSLDVSGLTALTTLNCNMNDLVTLRAAGVSFGFWKNKKKQKAGEGCNANDNQLDAVALNQFYTDLAAGIPGASFLNVENNPGTDSHDPTIATNKGYVVFA
jgi:Leucine-rich repeat (LRR) protein